jgi:hypothetical protein
MAGREDPRSCSGRISALRQEGVDGTSVRTRSSVSDGEDDTAEARRDRRDHRARPWSGKGPGKGEHARSSLPRRRRRRTDRDEIAGPGGFEIEEHRRRGLRQDDGHHGHGVYLVDRIDELLLLLLFFLLLAGLDRRAERAGVFAVEGFFERPGEVTLLGVHCEHPHPGHHLQGQPMPAEEMHSGEQRKAFGERRLQSDISLDSINRGASENTRCLSKGVLIIGSAIPIRFTLSRLARSLWRNSWSSLATRRSSGW